MWFHTSGRLTFFPKVSGPRSTKGLINILMPLCVTPRRSTRTKKGHTNTHSHTHALWHTQTDVSRGKRCTEKRWKRRRRLSKMLTVNISANHRSRQNGTCRKTTYHINISAGPVIQCLSPDFHVSRWRGQWWSCRFEVCLSRDRRVCFIICKRDTIGWFEFAAIPE